MPRTLVLPLTLLPMSAQGASVRQDEVHMADDRDNEETFEETAVLGLPDFHAHYITSPTLLVLAQSVCRAWLAKRSAQRTRRTRHLAALEDVALGIIHRHLLPLIQRKRAARAYACRAAISIQAATRGYLVRAEMRRLDQWAAATVVAATWRGVRARLGMARGRMQSAAILIQVRL